MTSSQELPAGPAVDGQPVEELLHSPELAWAVENDDFKQLLDHVPVAIVISWPVKGQQRIFYANAAFEGLFGQPRSAVEGSGWQVLDVFAHEDDPQRRLGQAVLDGEDFLGVFGKVADGGPPVLVQAYASTIENEDGTEHYRIAALVDVTAHARAERDDLERRLRDKDLLLKELQHRVKNNLQLITALIRLEARSASRGDRVDLDRLAGRIDALALLYQALSEENWGQEVDLGHYLGQIATAAMHSHAVPGIGLDLKVTYAPASINVAMPAGLLVNELLTNAFKYAFAGRERGTITLQCDRADDDRYCLVFADDGVGLAAGATWPRPEKLGMLILQTLRENTVALDFAVESAPGRGLRVTIRFKHKPSLRRPN
jgi:PAS domain S-box-containing protein